MNNSVIYARFSSSNQREESIEGQIRECTARAKSDGYNIVKIYRDDAVSGTSVNGRTAFLQMIEDAKSGFFQRIYIYKYDRFARNVVDSHVYEQVLSACNVELVSIKEGVPDGASGFLVKGMHELLAQYYSVNLSENVKRGHETNALKCKWNGAHIYGYRRSKDGYFEIVEHEAEAIRLMYVLYSKGYTMKQIVEHLKPYDAGTKKGWNIMKVSRYLRSPRYKGTYKYDSHIVENAIPAIVTAELWEEVNQMLDNKPNCAPRTNNELYPLSTKLFDEHGNAYVGTSGTSHTGKTYYYYKNTATGELVRKDKIDNIVIEALSDVLNENEHILEQIVDNVMLEQENALQETTRAIASAIEKQASIENKIENCLDAICESGSRPELIQRIDELKEEKAELEKFITGSKDMYLTRDMIIFALEQMRDKLAPQFLADGMVENVVILDTKELVITFKIMKKTSSDVEPLKVCIRNEWWSIGYHIQTKKSLVRVHHNYISLKTFATV